LGDTDSILTRLESVIHLLKFQKFHQAFFKVAPRRFAMSVGLYRKTFNRSPQLLLKHCQLVIPG